MLTNAANKALADRHRIEDWGQTIGLALLAATIPVLLGCAIAASVPALGVSTPIEPSEARIIAAWGVLAMSPVIVLFLARKAASLTSGSRMLRASLVGLAPGMLVLSFGVRAVLTGIPGPPVTVAVWVAWTVINWLPALLAAARTRRTGATSPSTEPSTRRTTGMENREVVLPLCGAGLPLRPDAVVLLLSHAGAGSRNQANHRNHEGTHHPANVEVGGEDECIRCRLKWRSVGGSHHAAGGGDTSG